MNSKLGAFTKWLQSHYPAVANAFTEAESILIEEDYNFKLLKHALLDSNMGCTKLHRIGLTYGLIDCMANCLEDFRIDWRRCNAAAEALLDVSIGEHSIYIYYNRPYPSLYYFLIPAREKWPFALLLNPYCSTAWFKKSPKSFHSLASNR